MANTREAPVCICAHITHTHTDSHTHTPNQREVMVVLHFSDKKCERKMLLAISVRKGCCKYYAMAVISIEAHLGDSG